MKARFRVTSEASADQRTTIHKIRTIQPLRDLDNGETYYFPTNLQPISQHPELATLPPMKLALKAITKRNHYRNVIVTMTPELADLYSDEEGNVVFKGVFLEEIFEDGNSTVTAVSPATNRNSTPTEPKKSLHTIVKDIVLDEFTGQVRAETSSAPGNSTAREAIISVNRYGIPGRDRYYREWRRGDPNVNRNMWDSKKPLGKAELYIYLALLIGFATVVVGCWLSDNCWSPEPEHLIMIA